MRGALFGEISILALLTSGDKKTYHVVIFRLHPPHTIQADISVLSHSGIVDTTIIIKPEKLTVGLAPNCLLFGEFTVYKFPKVNVCVLITILDQQNK